MQVASGRSSGWQAWATALSIEICQSIVSMGILFGFLAVAVVEDVLMRIRGGRSLVDDIRIGMSRKRPPSGPQGRLAALARQYGLAVEEHSVETKDGFILLLQRLTHCVPHKGEAPQNKGTILLQHGLFQTSLSFCSDRGRGGSSLAFMLAKEGYDVWLSNTRGNLLSREHKYYSQSEPEFWDFGIDELVLDFEADVNYITEWTGESSIVYVGHSQGSAMGIEALAEHPHLCDKIKLFVAMSPGVHVHKFQKPAMQMLRRLYDASPSYYYGIFGVKDFLPYMETTRTMLGYRVFPYVAFVMFRYLFGWGDTNWDCEIKPTIYSETPGGTSVRTIAHWLQRTHEGNLSKYDWGPQKNMEVYGSETAPAYDVTNVKCPVAVFYGGQDNVINVPKMVKELPTESVVHVEATPHHEHMDNLYAMDMHEVFYPQFLKVLRHHAPAGDK
eukprot:GFYU01004253.1.p1 GENE.GFYU01004253.1~~GFYU01004253.1.p1  ORF type:complete len:443 (-),score=104.39 GFYU01004253.1:153-1481(-)